MQGRGSRSAPIEVLLVEDGPGDVRLTREAIRDAGAKLALHVANDGIEALEFLGRKGQFSGAPRPNLILLDLNLPRLDGREVLEAIKGDPALMNIPVVILTTSESETDVMQSYGLHANCFITKPTNVEALVEILHFWVSVARLPREVGH
jgi:CheY-like chemotaxis protein